MERHTIMLGASTTAGGKVPISTLNRQSDFAQPANRAQRSQQLR